MERNNRIILISAMVIFILTSLIILNNNSSGEIINDAVCIKDNCYLVEIADSPNERSKGLMEREFLATNRGMLFIFPFSEKYSFWMKNTLIYLDIIWIDSNNKIVHINQNTPPCNQDPCPLYGPSEEALYVLELSAGEVKRINAEVGDFIEIKLDSK